MLTSVATAREVSFKTLQAVATEVNMTIQCNLQVFLYWYHDHRKRVLIPAAADCDVAAIRLAVKTIYAEKRSRNCISRTSIQVILEWNLNGGLLKRHSCTWQKM